MPNATLTEALKEAYAAAPTAAVIFDTLEFRHASLDAPIRVVNAPNDLQATLEPYAPLDPGGLVTFSACGFEFDLPEQSEEATPQLKISVDNVDREIVQALERVSEFGDKLYVTYRPFLSTDLSAPQMDPVWHLVVTEISAGVQRIEAMATLVDLVNRRFPLEDYTIARFPGLANDG